MIAADAPGVRAPLAIVRLSPLMGSTTGRAEVRIGLIDGPVAADHAHLASESIQLLDGPAIEPSTPTVSAARAHGTYVAGILSARRGSPAPAICPGCTLLVRPIFFEPGRCRRGHAEREPWRAGRRHRRLRRGGCVGSEPERRARDAFAEPGGRAGAGPRPRRGARRARRRGGGQSGHARRLRHHAASLGRFPSSPATRQAGRMAASNLGQLDRAPGAHGVRRGASRASASTAIRSPRRDERRGAVRHRRHRAAVVGVPAGERSRGQSAVTRADRRRTTVVPPLLDAWAAYELLQHRRVHG